MALGCRRQNLGFGVIEMDKKQTQWMVVALGAVLLLAGCQQQTEEKAPPRERAENAQVGAALTGVPEFFRVESNEGEQFTLVPKDETILGRVSIEAGATAIGGVNLVAAVEKHKAAIEAIEGSEYKGQRELGSHLGTAFYSRGLYPDDGGQITEETVIFLVHPWGDRTLQLIYRYPAGDDSKERLADQLFAVLEELEAMPKLGEGEAQTPTE
jgi:cytochrome oxidase Cu insertion factor (SCO1/SenC/PrrC family)